MAVVVTLQRDADDDEDESSSIGKVVSLRYGMDKMESWWIVIGDMNSNALLSLKRVAIGKKATKVNRVNAGFHYIHITT